MQRVRVLGYSALKGVSLSLQERGRKILRAKVIREFEETAFPRQQSRCPSRLSDYDNMHKAHTGSGQTEPQEKRQWTESYPIQEVVHEGQLLGEGGP